MTPRDFVYWLQGYMEIQNPKTLGEKQVAIIKDHLSLVFKKETPERNLEDPDLEGLLPIPHFNPKDIKWGVDGDTPIC